eukprot:superscaffoldBa00000139_g2006
MGGLGNGRRGGRSPPLMIGALIACILVLGFNYWVSSSRNLELQTKLYELEGQVRRGAAERGVAEMKKNEFQDEIQRQKEQISHIESLYKRQLEGAQNTCSQEKQENAVKEGQEMTGLDAVKTATAESHTPSISQPKGNETPELLTNEIIVDKGPDDPAKGPSQKEPQSVPSATAIKQEVVLPLEGADKTEEGETETSKLLTKNLTEDKETEVMDAHEEGTQTEEADPRMEGMLIGQGKAVETTTGQKLDEPEDYDADEQVVGGVDLDKQQQSKRVENIDKDMEEELADYNGDDENEGEFEADKQAELAQI